MSSAVAPLPHTRARGATSESLYPAWAPVAEANGGHVAARSQDAWNAVLRRDRRYDGKFVYAAVTTGIYCRPSCPARHPQARNTLLFPNAEAAELAGFIPCSRCSPGANALTAAEHCIKAALIYIEDHYDQTITLARLAKYTGFSANHLQQLFQRIIGLTPKAFSSAARLAHFKLRLRAGDSILRAGYAVGYGSSRAIYQNAKKTLGMTPALYRRGGDGLKIRYTHADGPSARILVAATADGVCSLLLGEDAATIRDLREEFPKAILSREPKPSPLILAAIRSCGDEDPLLSQLPAPLRRQVFLSRLFASLLRSF